MKTGGHYYTNYDPAARIGDPGTVRNTVLTYVPLEMVAIHVKLGTKIFPEAGPPKSQKKARDRSRAFCLHLVPKGGLEPPRF